MKSNFWARTLTGFFFVLVILAAVWFGYWTFWLLLFAIAVIGLQEYVRAFSGREYMPSAIPVQLAGILVFTLLTTIFFGFLTPKAILLCLPVIFLLFVYELYHRSAEPFQRAALAIGGIVYIPVSISLFAMVGLWSGKYEPKLVMSVFLLIWASDTFAYLAGRAFGKTPLFPRISPKKTWEGSIGGMLGTVGVSLLLYYFFGLLLYWQWMLLAAVILVFGTWGDLIESMLKRSLGLKDSGSILPGHGGVLDRFDSLLFSLPFIAALLYFF